MTLSINRAIELGDLLLCVQRAIRENAVGLNVARKYDIQKSVAFYESRSARLSRLTHRIYTRIVGKPFKSMQ
jgi:hypothetical protein